MLSSGGVAPLPPGFHKLLSVTVTTFAVFSLQDVPSWWWRQLHVVCVIWYVWPPYLLLAKWRNLPGNSWCRFYVVQFRTVIFRQMRMISFLCGLAVLPTCYLLHDSRLLGLTLRPSAPVFRCHRVSWTRGRLALTQEAVRASLDSQPKILSSAVEETLQRIMGQTNNDCRFRIFISTNSLHLRRLLTGRFDSRPMYVLVHNFLRNLCNGSKKWRWLIQWMI